MIGFVLVAVTVIALIHLYLYRRLVRDTTRPGLARRAGAIVLTVLGALVPATLGLVRAGVNVMAWPGYIWLALMFYLLVALLLLEVLLRLPMLVGRAVARRRAGRPGAQVKMVGDGTPAELVPASVPAGAPETGAVHPPAPPHRPGLRAAPDQPGGRDPAPDDPAPAPPDSWHDPQRRLLLARGAAIFAGLTAVGVTGYGMRTALGPPRIDRVRIPLAKLPPAMDGFRIATVSDIHLGPLSGRGHAERLVQMINRMDADIVAVVGDLVDGTVAELGDAAAPLRGLRSRYGAYFVTGNHEYYSGAQQWIDELNRLGLRVLQNQRREIVTPGGVLDLAGVNDIGGGAEGSPGGPDFDAALGGRDTSRPVVLLAHQPVQVHEAARHHVDLQLSGHTHGGQLYPFHYVVRAVQPVVSGYATVDGTQIYVTNGAGFWGPPVRVGAPPEITLVELRAP